MTSRRVLITGLAGFTGRYLSAEMAQAGYEVHGIGAEAAVLPNYFQVDLGDRVALKAAIDRIRPVVVIHLAAIAFVGHGDAEAFYRVNVIGTRNLLEALAASSASLECVLLASSANIYGNATAGVIAEDVRPDPANDYAVSKLAMEYMARLWCGRLPIVMVRPFNYTGVGQSESFILPKIVSHFRRRASRIELGNVDVWRDFSDVRAVVAAYRGLVEARPVGQVFNICSGKAVSLREVLAFMEGIAGYQIEVSVNPDFVRANEVKTLTGSADRLRAALGDWKIYPLPETLAWMYRA